jgi:allophanate hydrolase
MDVTPFTDAAKLLYQGPWVAERFAAVGAWLLANPGKADAVVEKIILGAQGLLATDAFKAMYRLQELRRVTEPLWKQMDVLVLPTAPAVYRIADVLANPVELNSRLGTYTNFVNLLDLCAVSLPAGKKENGVPFGVSLIAPACHDQRMLGISARFLGEEIEFKSGGIHLAVVGAHLRGQPLNVQLQELGATFVAQTKTKPVYRLHALRGTVPPKPGMIRDEKSGGAIEVEVYSLSAASFGTFVEKIPPPLCIGTIDLQDGTRVKGFLCEPAALEGAEEITHLGGWRNYLARQNAARA